MKRQPHSTSCYAFPPSNTPPVLLLLKLSSAKALRLAFVQGSCHRQCAADSLPTPTEHHKATALESQHHQRNGQMGPRQCRQTSLSLSDQSASSASSMDEKGNRGPSFITRIRYHCHLRCSSSSPSARCHADAKYYCTNASDSQTSSTPFFSSILPLSSGVPRQNDRPCCVPYFTDTFRMHTVCLRLAGSCPRLTQTPAMLFGFSLVLPRHHQTIGLFLPSSPPR